MIGLSGLADQSAGFTCLNNISSLPSFDTTHIPAYNYAPVVGQSVLTDFSDQSADVALFDMSGFTYVSDGGTPALQASGDRFSPAYFRTKQSFSDVEIFMKYRLTNDGTFGPNYAPNPQARYVDDNNKWEVQNYLHTASTNAPAVIEKRAGAQEGYNGPTSPGIGDIIHNRFMRVQLVGDLMRYRSWLSTETEPTTWDFQHRYAVNDTNNDIIESGKCGIWSKFNSNFIYQLTITPLTRTDSNYVHNAPGTSGFWSWDGVATDLPAFWAYDTTPASGNTIGVVTAADQNGVSRPMLGWNLATAQGALLSQTIYNSNNPGPSSVFGSRIHTYPWSPTTNYLDVYVWSKANNIIDTSGGSALGAAYVNYYYAKDATFLSYPPNDQSYFTTLGPATGKIGGTGTWDWTLTKYRMPWHSSSTEFRAALYIGLHNTCTGQLWISDIYCVPSN